MSNFESGRNIPRAIPRNSRFYHPVTSTPTPPYKTGSRTNGYSARRPSAPSPAADDEVAIAVMGATGSGKTSFINLASNSSLKVGRGLQSCTATVQVTQPLDLDGRKVVLIDTPGFDDTTRSDTDVLTSIAAFLETTYQHGKKLAGVIYLHRISDFRMGGISTRNFRMFRQLCGETTLRNVVLVTNMWGEVDPEIGEEREKELAERDIFFKPVLDKGALLLRHDNTLESTQKILRYIKDNVPLPLRIQRELVDERKDISETAAGEELNKEFMEQLRKHREEMQDLQEEMKEAIRAKDDETRKEVEAAKQNLQKEIERVQTDSNRLATDYKEEKIKLERKLEEMERNARQENERIAAEHRRQIGDLENHLARNVSQSAAERAEMTRQLEGMRSHYESAMRRKQRQGGFFGSIGRALDSLFGS